MPHRRPLQPAANAQTPEAQGYGEQWHDGAESRTFAKRWRFSYKMQTREYLFKNCPRWNRPVGGRRRKLVGERTALRSGTYPWMRGAHGRYGFHSLHRRGAADGTEQDKGEGYAVNE